MRFAMRAGLPVAYLVVARQLRAPVRVPQGTTTAVKAARCMQRQGPHTPRHRPAEFGARQHRIAVEQQCCMALPPCVAMTTMTAGPACPPWGIGARAITVCPQPQLALFPYLLDADGPPPRRPVLGTRRHTPRSAPLGEAKDATPPHPNPACRARPSPATAGAVDVALVSKREGVTRMGRLRRGGCDGSEGRRDGGARGQLRAHREAPSAASMSLPSKSDSLGQGY